MVYINVKGSAKYKTIKDAYSIRKSKDSECGRRDIKCKVYKCEG